MKTLHEPVALNSIWHMRHRLPPDATLEQRIAWHEAHVHNCACRPMPISLVEAARRLRARGPGARRLRRS